MPRVSSQTARKDYPSEGIKKGDVYYKWAFRFGGKYKSLTYPRQSQLTQSAYLGAKYDLTDRLQALTHEDVTNAVIEEIAGEVRELGETQQESLDNMPESLQYSPTGELLQERIDACENAADELETIDIPDEVTEPSGIEFAFEDHTPESGDYSTEAEFDEALEEWEERKSDYETEQEQLQTEFEDYEQQLDDALQSATEVEWE